MTEKGLQDVVAAETRISDIDGERGKLWYVGYDIEDLEVGMSASFAKTITEADIVMFAGVSGDMNPVHLDAEYAEKTVFKGRIAHGMLSAAFISTVLGTKLPGPGTVYLAQSLKFKAPVRIGDKARSDAEDRTGRSEELGGRPRIDETEPEELHIITRPHHNG